MIEKRPRSNSKINVIKTNTIFEASSGSIENENGSSSVSPSSRIMTQTDQKFLNRDPILKRAFTQHKSSELNQIKEEIQPILKLCQDQIYEAL